LLRVFWLIVISLLPLLSFVDPAQAKGVLYVCDITEKREGVGWIPNKMAIVVTQEGRVVVSDGIILRFNRRPMQVRVSRDTDQKMVLRWTLKDAMKSRNWKRPAFDYSATLTKSNNSIAVYARPENSPNRFRGKGSCVPRYE